MEVKSPNSPTKEESEKLEELFQSFLNEVGQIHVARSQAALSVTTFPLNY
jgi:hypothetical protein